MLALGSLNTDSALGRFRSTLQKAIR